MSNRNENKSQNNSVNLNQLITIGDLLKFKDDLLSEIAKLLKAETPSTFKQWLKSSEVRKLLNISPGTLQAVIHFSKSHMYVRVNDGLLVNLAMPMIYPT